MNHATNLLFLIALLTISSTTSAQNSCQSIPQECKLDNTKCSKSDLNLKRSCNNKRPEPVRNEMGE